MTTPVSASAREQIANLAACATLAQTALRNGETKALTAQLYEILRISRDVEMSILDLEKQLARARTNGG